MNSSSRLNLFGFKVNIFGVLVVFGIAFFCCLTIQAAPAAPQNPPYCSEAEVCGIARQNPITRKFDFVGSSKCRCAPQQSCKTDGLIFENKQNYRCVDRPFVAQNFTTTEKSLIKNKCVS